jgi:hypothetical protein
VRRLAITQLGAELDGAWHERPGSSRDFFVTAVEQDAFGDVETFRTADNLAASEEMALGDGPQKIKLERRSYDEQIFDERLHGKKCGVVQGFEVDGSVDCMSGVIKVLADGHFNLGAPFFGDAELWPKPLVDRGAVIHRDEYFKVCAFHGVWFEFAPDSKGFGSLAGCSRGGWAEVFLVLAKQKLIGHTGDVVAYDDVTGFRLCRFFVGERHGSR